MSAIAVLCLAALVAVVIVGFVGALSSGTASLSDVYARHEARQAVVGDVRPTDPWITDARAIPAQRGDSEPVMAPVPEPTGRQVG